MNLRLATATLAAALTLGAGSMAHADDVNTSVGYLRCDVEGGVSFIFGSTRDVTCTYEPAGDEPTQHYTGSIDRYGVDIGFMDSSVMIWGVVTTGENVPPGGLSGAYAGPTANVAAGLGVGVNALVLGDESIALQPLSIEGGTGLNIAAGVAELTLESAD